ncbi:hypothetical protein ABTO78_20340, partial [Acinetobacter baumannii]
LAEPGALGHGAAQLAVDGVVPSRGAHQGPQSLIPFGLSGVDRPLILKARLCLSLATIDDQAASRQGAFDQARVAARARGEPFVQRFDAAAQ